MDGMANGNTAPESESLSESAISVSGFEALNTIVNANKNKTMPLVT